MVRMRMPSSWLAWSRGYMARATSSATTSGDSWAMSFMDVLSGESLLLDQGRDAVGVLAVGLAEVQLYLVHGGQADGVGPGQRPLRVIDAQAHGGIRRGGVADTLV